jgi:hypothetical protein
VQNPCSAEAVRTWAKREAAVRKALAGGTGILRVAKSLGIGNGLSPTSRR